MLDEVAEVIGKEYGIGWDDYVNTEMETFENEIFKDIKVDGIDYSDLYEVTNYGRVWSINRQIFLKHGVSSNRYHHVTLCKGLQITHSVHKLVLTAFKRPKKSYEECRHLDGNKDNNHIDNLEWGTGTDNQDDRIIHGTNLKNEAHPMASLTNKQVTEIRKKYSTGEYSQRQLAKEYGVTQANIYYIVNEFTFKDI